jgi:hypothetical protein
LVRGADPGFGRIAAIAAFGNEEGGLSAAFFVDPEAFAGRFETR